MTDQEDFLQTDMDEYVTLTIGGQLFGVPVTSVHDVFSPDAITGVPLSSPEIAGVLNLRGRIVTAIDARVKLGLSKRESNEHSMAVGIELDGEAYGVIIDSVGEVLRLGLDEYEPNPINLDERWQAISAGVYRLENELLVVLDVKKFLSFGNVKSAA
ncbi:MAG: chemotaxis protein CheW [Pseudomonadota bacterium]